MNRPKQTAWLSGWIEYADWLEAENAKLRSGELKSVMRINAENAKLKHRVDEVEARNLDLFVSEAKLREIMQELVDDYAVGPIERTKIQAALK
jgi:hypothetical protein